MRLVNMHEAKSQLSSLVEAAMAGEEIIIAKAGTPRSSWFRFAVIPGRGNPAVSRGRFVWQQTLTRPRRRSSRPLKGRRRETFRWLVSFPRVIVTPSIEC
jgi:antitoxin (DNA-binding transcriptional repressor) of toxin-antitoxin stability system